MATVTTRVEWAAQHSDETAQKIFEMVEEMTASGKLISRSNPEPGSSSASVYPAHNIIAVWRDLEAANEYLAIVNDLGAVSAAIV